MPVKSSTLWTAVTLLVALPVATPIVVVLLSFVFGDGDVTRHLADTVLFPYVANTFILMLQVALIALPIGVGTAWLTAAYRFPGSGWLAVLLALPLAMPSYVIGYVYADLLDFSGPVQRLLRDLGIETRLPNIRSPLGAAAVIALVLYPYIFMLARVSFAQQSVSMMEAARTLGATPVNAFLRIAMPVARPAIIGGLALVLMETVADYGVVAHYGVPTLTTGIFRTWFAMGEIDAALQLAGCLLLVAVVLLVLEQSSRRGRIANPVTRNRAVTPAILKGWRGWLASVACLAPCLLGFIIPVASLLELSITAGDTQASRLFDYGWNSLSVGIIAAALAALAAIFLAYAERLHPTRVIRSGVRMATLGYALPGMLLAVGLLYPLTMTDRAHATFWLDNFDINVGLILTGSAAGLVLVYLARFLTVAFNGIQASLLQINRRYDEAARTLGASETTVLRRLHLPLLRPSVQTALVLVFIDTVKELPATLVLRPFNFETLATRVFRLASDERLAEASTAALCIVIVALVPTILLQRNIHRRDNAL